MAGQDGFLALDDMAPRLYRHAQDETLVDIPDAVLIVINPARPSSVEESLKPRLDFEKVIDAKDKVPKRVVIVRGIDMSWERRQRPDPLEVPLHLGPEARKEKEDEWRDGAEKGYELARRIGAEVSIACSRTGEGVKEALDDLAVKALEKKRAKEDREAEGWDRGENRGRRGATKIFNGPSTRFYTITQPG